MGQGHIRLRKGVKGDTWEVRAYAGRHPETGKKRYVTRTVRGGKRDAQRVLTQLLGDIDRGAYGGPDVTMVDLFQRWQESAWADWSPSTSAAYDVYLRCHIVPALGRTMVRDLRTADLDALYGRLRSKGLAPASVAKAHNIIRRALAQAVRWGWIQANPADHARRPRLEAAELHPPDADQVRALLARAIDDRPMFATYVQLAAATGARRGEVCALRWSDVDLEQGTVVIGRSIVHGSRAMAEKDTKTHRIRRMALDPATVQVLAAHRLRCKEAAFACGARLGPSAHLFSSDAACRKPWRPDTVTARFARLCRDAGVSGVRLHDLRHYVATSLLTAGVDIGTVAGRLGHANASTTLNIYGHFQPAANWEAAATLARLLVEG